MTLREKLRSERGFISLGSTIIGVALALAVVVALGSVTTLVLNASASTFENSQRANVARSTANQTSMSLIGPLPAGSRAFTADVNGASINGWRWTSGSSAGDKAGLTLYTALPKLGHTVAECQAMETTRVDNGDCVVSQRILRVDPAGVRVLYLASTAPSATQFTVTAPSGANKVRFYLRSSRPAESSPSPRSSKRAPPRLSPPHRPRDQSPCAQWAKSSPTAPIT
jgi:hypothetical protein